MAVANDPKGGMAPRCMCWQCGNMQGLRFYKQYVRYNETMRKERKRKRGGPTAQVLPRGPLSRSSRALDTSAFVVLIVNRHSCQ